MANKERDRLKAVADSLKVYDPAVHGKVNPFKDREGVVNKEYQQNNILYDEIKEAVTDEILNADQIEYQKNLEKEAVMDSLNIPRDPMLEGTGQPGELYGAPKEVDPWFQKEMESEKARQDSIENKLDKDFDEKGGHGWVPEHDKPDPLLEEAGLKLGENFSLLDALNGITDEGLEFVPLDNNEGGK
tara:strand:+ start:4223 stop:4783 length:561 start_codon:yes stop_codon:yes gene_type:complete